MYTDKVKVEFFGQNDRVTVRRPIGQGFKPKYTIKTVKHRGGNIMVWGCMSRNGVSKLHRIDGKMNAQGYIHVLKKNVKSSARMLRLRPNWWFYQDNDPKHTAKVTKEYFKRAKIRVMPTPSMNPDLNPIENLWHRLKKMVKVNYI